MILAFGGETGFFQPVDSSTIENTNHTGDEADAFDNSFARCAMRATGSTSYGESPDIGGVLLNAWLHVKCAVADAGNGDQDNPIIVWADNAGTDRVRITWNVVGTLVKLQYDLGAGWVTAGSFSIALDDGQVFDLNVVCNSSGGSMVLYTAGTERINVDVDTSAINELNKCKFYGMTISGGATYVNYSEIVIADEPTVGMRVMTYYITGDEATGTEWTTGTAADVDEIVYSDADGLNSATAGQLSLFDATSVSAIDPDTAIRAFCVTARARKGATGPTNLQLAIRVNGTDYFSANKALGIGFSPVVNVWETNPDTGVAWTVADLLSGTTGLVPYGVKSIA